MSDELVIKLEEETQEAVAETVATTLEAAVEIAELIVTAKEEGEHTADLTQEIVYTLGDLFGRMAALDERIGMVIDLAMGLSDQIAALATLEVAELIEDHTEKEVEEIVETVEEIAPVVETVETAVEPEIRKSTKRRWI